MISLVLSIALAFQCKDLSGEYFDSEKWAGYAISQGNCDLAKVFWFEGNNCGYSTMVLDGIQREEGTGISKMLVTYDDRPWGWSFHIDWLDPAIGNYRKGRYKKNSSGDLVIEAKTYRKHSHEFVSEFSLTYPRVQSLPVSGCE